MSRSMCRELSQCLDLCVGKSMSIDLYREFNVQCTSLD